MTNTVILIGNLGRDPESRQLANGSVCNFSLATTETWKDKAGEKQKKTTWHRCSAFGKSAEIIQQYAAKGTLMYVSGSIDVSDYNDKETGAKRQSFQIKVRDFQFLGGKSEAQGNSAPAQTAVGAPSQDFDDPIPF